jgi:peptidoglycan/LPS O-acetylase OafA/YrhL
MGYFMNDDTNGATPFKNIDLEVLRCFAVIMVVINHSAFGPALAPFFLGYSGVDIFFAISGYIITVGLLTAIEKKQRTPTILKSFWTKRVFRILPMAYLWTIVPIILAITFNSATGGFSSPSQLLHDAVANVTQTANFHWQACLDNPELRNSCGINAWGATPLSPFWSLSTEEQFYILFPLLLLFISRSKLMIILAAIPAILLFFDRHDYLYILRFDAIIVGVLIAFAQKKKWYSEFYPRFLEKKGLGVLALLSLVVLAGMVPAMSTVSFYQSIVVIIAFTLVFIASFNANLFTRPLPWLRPFFLWLGDRSYAIYLIHVPAIIITGELYARFEGPIDNAQLHTTVISIVILFILVELSASIIERPFRRLGRRIAKNIETKDQPQKKKSLKKIPASTS